MRVLQLVDPLCAASSTSVGKATAFHVFLLILTLVLELPSITIPRNQSVVPSMDRGRVRYIQSKNTEAHQYEPPLPMAQSNLRLRSSQGDNEEFRLTLGNHYGSGPFSQQHSSWIRTSLLATRSSALTIITVAARPDLRAVCIHGSLLVAFWVVSFTFSQSLECPTQWLLIPWTALCWVEFLVCICVGLAFCRDFMTTRRVLV